MHDGTVILIVEDECTIRTLLADALEDLGYVTLQADDGPAGLEILQSSQRIDLLLTDVGLPGLNGRQVAAGGRAVRPELKVLFMTGYAEKAAMVNGAMEPGTHLMRKPFTEDALIKRISEILEKAA